jgi:nucleoside-diphosphate-sugar epimerase
MLRLIEAGDALDPFETFHMEGHWDPDGLMLPGAIRRALDRPELPLRAFPWWLLTLGAPFVTFFREMQEMRYLWRQPLRLDNRRLVGVLGAEPHTPLDEAVRQTLIGLGCLDGVPATSRSETVRAAG